MDGYSKQAIREAMIAKGKDPDAGPGPFERFFFKYIFPVLGLLFWVGFFMLIFRS